jgi:hypothetical protein
MIKHACQLTITVPYRSALPSRSYLFKNPLHSTIDVAIVALKKQSRSIICKAWAFFPLNDEISHHVIDFDYKSNE